MDCFPGTSVGNHCFCFPLKYNFFRSSNSQDTGVTGPNFVDASAYEIGDLGTAI